MSSAPNRAAALTVLEVPESALTDVPKITPQLIIISNLLLRMGNRINLARQWPAFLEQTEDPVAWQVIAAYRRVRPCLQRYAPIEAYCLAADVSPSRILEIITGICVRLGAQTSAIIAAVSHPRIVEKSVSMALTDEGIADRTILHKATGFLPTPKTSVSIVNAPRVEVTAQAAVAAPTAERTIRGLVDRFNESPRALPAPGESAPVVDVMSPMVAVGRPADSEDDDVLED